MKSSYSLKILSTSQCNKTLWKVELRNTERGLCSHSRYVHSSAWVYLPQIKKYNNFNNMRIIPEYKLRSSSLTALCSRTEEGAARAFDILKYSDSLKCLSDYSFIVHNLVEQCPLHIQINWICCGCWKTCWIEADFHPAVHRTSQFETLRTHHSQGKFPISTHITGLFISNYSICSRPVLEKISKNIMLCTA